MKKSTQKFKKGMLVFLTIGMLMSSLPITHAQEQAKDNSSVGELVEKRELFSKQFQNEDGTITAVSYNYPIHYETSTGKMKDIDNTIINDISYQPLGLAKQVSKEQYYTSKDNPYIDVLFNKQTDSNNLIKINIDGYDISWGISNLNNSAATPLNDSETDSQYNLKNVTGGIKYTNAFENADLYYYITSANLKEEIILNEKSNINQIIYNIETNLTPFKTEHNLVIFQNENGDNIFSFQNPYMYDNAEKSSMTFDTTVDIKKTENGYQLIYQLDTEWLNNKDRVYPIVIDPTVSNGRNQVNVLDTYVHPGDNASHNHVNEDRLWVGKVNGTSRAFMNWADLPTINGTINTSHVSFNFFKGTSTWGPLELWRINSSWNSLNLTWDIHNNLSKTQLMTNLYPTYTNGYQNFSLNVTDTVKGWYNGSIARNGFMVKYANESYNDYNTIVSSDSGVNSDFWPCLWINYTEAQPKPKAYVASYYSSGNQDAGNQVANVLNIMGYSVTNYNAPSTQSIINNITSPVVAYVGHGNYDIMTLGDSGVRDSTIDKNIETKTSEHDYWKVRTYVGIRRFNLSPVNLMIFAGCKTSDNSQGVHPIARSAVDYGAKSSIGWTDSFDVSATSSYLKNLMTELYDGKTIQQAIDNANKYPTTDSRTRTAYAWGNTSTTIKLLQSYSTTDTKTIKKALVKEKKPVDYLILAENDNSKNSISKSDNLEFTKQYIINNINPNFNENDYIIENMGRYITFTYAPFGIKTENIYTAIVENNRVTSISSYVNKDFEKLKENFSNINKLDLDTTNTIKENLITDIKNVDSIEIHEEGYIYKNNKISYYIIYDFVNYDGTLGSNIVYHDI